MKFIALLGLGLIPFAVAQSETLAPPPTESYGCEPHGDHYHCDGHVSETSAMTSMTSTPSPTPTGEHDHDDHDHEDHDHEDHDHEHEDEHDDGVTSSLPPSPTASTGCEPHGDHWHCDGPAETEAESETTPTPTGAAAATMAPLAGAVVAALMAF